MTTDKKKLILIKQALDDLQAGVLSEFSFAIVVGMVVNPAKITTEDIKWAQEALKKRNGRKSNQ